MRRLDVVMGIVLIVTVGAAMLAVAALIGPNQWLTLGAQDVTPAPLPQLVLSNPAEGAVLGGTTLTVSFSTAHFQLAASMVPLAEAGRHPEVNRAGEGHVHLTLDLQPLVVWTRSAPYTFNNVPPGDHQLTVELVNVDHSSLTPPVVRTVHFKTTGPMTLARSGRPEEVAGSLAVLALGGLLLVTGWVARRRGAGAEGRG